MECQSSDSKKLFKVFDASKRKRTRKKREGLDETNSGATDDSNSGCQANICRIASTKASLQNISPAHTVDMMQEGSPVKREISSASMARSPVEVHRSSRSPRRHRRPPRDGMSLALKAGMVSTPRSISPRPEGDTAIESIPRDQDSFIYAFLEEAIKRDKKKHRHRRHERRDSRDRDASVTREHRHHRKRRDDVPSREHEKPTKDVSPTPAIDQTALLETFAKLCAQMNENNKNYNYPNEPPMVRTHSHKSLQCEPVSRRESFNVDRCPDRVRCTQRSREDVELSRIRSQDNYHGRIRSSEKIEDRKDKCGCFNTDTHKYSSKLDMTKSRMHHDEHYGGYREKSPLRCCDHYRRPERDYRDYDRRNDEDKRKFEQKASRSFEVHRDKYDDDRYRRTARSDKRYDEREKRYDEKVKYYDDRIYERDKYNKERRSKKNLERFERNSIASREDDFRDRYSERERDSGLSVADETSTVSGRSNYLRVVKQEISEQREAMDKMMKLWKELMRCFKGMSQTQGQDKAVNESATNARESAAAQLRLWRECMRRYETVARDVGDTDARLMEEINKQRSEMAEMANMWQECLQRYRDMSNDFNSLKQKLATSESPSRMTAAPLACAEGEGPAPPAPYRLPPTYPPMPAMGAFPNVGSPLRSRASAPPAWWWCDRARESPRRRSSPESRGSRDRDRDRDRRHRHKERDEPRYKEKPSKPSAARSEHRHRKR
ncbi:hypothetical protein O3G_MSEX013405 [Manduca sexta]|uniref:Uncharacterized protein n=1 Tax=Manduca sexta TaxID=7130 RepID=A0A922CXZ1_MANSE|nr:hypothetical protein O3G_MSEX013405 [Manduca sexta]KAG6462679.1 hypothetical protein O3G_MSEX013405 [Manduca sexta]